MENLELKITNPNAHIKKGVNLNSRYSPEEKTKLVKASKDFESMLTSMMIKSMTKTTNGLFGKDNYGGDVLDVLFESEIANKITESKSMGIADKIFSTLTGESIDNFTKSRMKINVNKNSIKLDKTRNHKKSDSQNVINKTTPSNEALQRIEKYDNIIEDAASKYGVDKNLIKSVILTESAGKVNAKSKADAKGLMQLIDSTATDMGVEDPWNPKDNIHGGAKYLSQLLKKFNGKTDLALAAYNAGPGNVSKYDGIPPFKETQAYIQRVNNYLNILE
jgi:Rod binding domain-containing protein